MKRKSTKNNLKLPEPVRKELATLAQKPESEIDFSDIPATTESDWYNAKRGKFYRPIKQQLTVRMPMCSPGLKNKGKAIKAV